MQTVLCVEWLLLKCKHSTLYHIETIFFLPFHSLLHPFTPLFTPPSPQTSTLIDSIFLTVRAYIDVYRTCTIAAAAAVADADAIVVAIVVAVTARYFV